MRIEDSIRIEDLSALSSHLMPLRYLVVPNLDVLACCFIGGLLVFVSLVFYSIGRRIATKRRLEACGLPSVYWRPKFVNYHPDSDDKKMASSSITNILPRMKRLQGPWGMYGTVYGFQPVIHVADPVPAAAILQQKTKAPAYNHFKNFCGEGVFTADGADWKEKRTAVLHALLRKKDWETGLSCEAHVAANQLSRLPENESVNIVPILQKATVGLIYRYITHTELQDSDEDYSDAASDTSSEASVDDRETLFDRYLASITKIRMIILAQSRSIWFLLPRWCYETFSSLYQEEEMTVGPIRAFARQACRAAVEGSPLHQLRTQCDVYKSPSQLSKNIVDEAITLLFAGQDTSAATLSWTLHLLSLYPDVQKRLHDEAKTCIGSEEHPIVEKDMIQKMTFLDAVIKESMRLYPVAPFVVRKLSKSVTIQDKSQSVTLPEDSIACIWIYGMHRNPDYWERPDDFLPDRWLSGDQKKSRGAYMPFASGPRNCVGQPLAHIVLRTLLARLVHRYKFEDPRLRPGVDPRMLLKDMQAGFTVLPQGGLELNIIRI